MKTDRPRQLLAVLTSSAWTSSIDLRRLLGWRSRWTGEPLTFPAFANALARASKPLIAGGMIEEKLETGKHGRPMRFLRRAKNAD